jgi:hypothetical protein
MAWEPFDAIWDRIVALEGQTFWTKTGKPFTYETEGRESSALWVTRDGRKINQRLSKSNFRQVYEMMQESQAPRRKRMQRAGFCLGYSL